MKLIGYWMASLLDEDLPLPQELVGQLPDDVRADVSSYLEKGVLFEHYRGYSWCRFRCSAPDEDMGSTELTDGEWVWPSGLVHYVREHSVVLPDDFLEKVNSGVVPGPACSEDATLDYWIDWARERRSVGLRKLLSQALMAARVSETVFIDAIIDEIAQREGHGIAKCAFANCNKQVLTGRRICARHLLSADELKSRATVVYRFADNLLQSRSN